MSRRKARETAFQMLFQMDVGKNDIVTAENTLLNAGLKGGYKAFAMDLVKIYQLGKDWTSPPHLHYNRFTNFYHSDTGV